MAESTEQQAVTERVDEVLERVAAGQRAAFKSLRTLVNYLDDAVPSLIDDPSLRKKVVIAIGDYYEQLASTGTEFVIRTVRRAIGTLDERPANSARSPDRRRQKDGIPPHSSTRAGDRSATRPPTSRRRQAKG